MKGFYKNMKYQAYKEKEREKDKDRKWKANHDTQGYNLQKNLLTQETKTMTGLQQLFSFLTNYWFSVTISCFVPKKT